MDAVTRVPAPHNEPVLTYAPGSAVTVRDTSHRATSSAGQAIIVQASGTRAGTPRTSQPRVPE